jgi:leucyl-tRNA synthetase
MPKKSTEEKQEKEIDFAAIEKKWQKEWEKAKIFHVKEDLKKKKFYVLEMFPYPSASFLHMGHVRNYSIGDVIARFRRMQGFNVLYPMGYDSFGLPAENAAKKAGIHPRVYTENAIKKIMEYQKALGLSYDWNRVISTHTPEYYKWNQWIFLKFLEKGLVYRKKSRINWCSKCNTVLANEEVVSGKCWRCDSEVSEKEMEQWFFKITEYADELLEDLDKLNWPEPLKLLQKNWIGKSYGIEIKFKIEGEEWPIFTTRPDTICGVTFMVISAQHPKLKELAKGTKQEKEVLKFSEKCKIAKSREEIESLSKEGVFTGRYAVNPLTKEKIPVWAGNFVLAEYGSGMVMAVPAHDQRDFEFAKKYDLPIKEVIRPVFGMCHENEEFRKTISAVIHRKKDNKFLFLKWNEFKWISPVVGGIEKGEDMMRTAEREVLEETGYKVKAIKLLGGETEEHFYAENKKVWRHRVDQPVLLELLDEKPAKVEDHEKNRHEAIWLDAEEALKTITHEYNKIGLLRYVGKDQAYAGEGILVNSNKFDGLNSRDAIEKISDFIEKNKLGKRTVNYRIRDWLISRQRYWGTPIPIVYCDKCGLVPVPETELPVLLPEDVKFSEKGNPILTSKKFQDVKCPICKGRAKRETDTMGGFMDSSWYFLRYCSPDEEKKPFGSKDVGYWMPVDQYIGGIEHAVGHLIYARFFTKALRDLGFLKFDEPFSSLFNQGIVYKDGKRMSKSHGNTVTQDEISGKCGIDAARLFLLFVASPESNMEWTEEGIDGMSRFIKKVIALKANANKNSSEKLEHFTNKTIKEVTENIENFKFNLAIIKLMAFAEHLEKGISKGSYETLLKLLSPFAPHIAEELWHDLGNKTFISIAPWPKCDEKKINPVIEQQEKASGQLSSDIRSVLRIINKTPKRICIYVIPKELAIYDSKALEREFSCKIDIFAVNDPKKHDPQNKAGKAKPGKPAIYIE